MMSEGVSKLTMYNTTEILIIMINYTKKKQHSYIESYLYIRLLSSFGSCGFSVNSHSPMHTSCSDSLSSHVESQSFSPYSV